MRAPSAKAILIGLAVLYAVSVFLNGGVLPQRSWSVPAEIRNETDQAARVELYLVEGGPPRRFSRENGPHGAEASFQAEGPILLAVGEARQGRFIVPFGWASAQAVRAWQGEQLVFCRIYPLERPQFWFLPAPSTLVEIKKGEVTC